MRLTLFVSTLLRPGILLRAGALLLAGTGCSLGTADVSRCTDNEACRETFGLNTICGEEGLCTVEPTATRCDRTFPEDLYDRRDAYADAVVFGNLMDRSETKQQARENAARLAAKQVNEAGALGERPLAMVFCTLESNHSGDGLDTGEAAVAMGSYLTKVVGVRGIVGPSSSNDTLDMFEQLRDADTVVISPSATSPALTDAEPPATEANPGYLWRTAPSDSLQGKVIALDMLARNVSHVALIVQEGAYGDGLVEIFDTEQAGGIATADIVRFDSSAQRTEAITQVGLGAAEEVLFISSSSADIIAFLDAAATNAGYASKALFLTDAAASQDVIDGSTPDAFARVRGTRPTPLELSEFVYQNFINGYQAEYGDDASEFSFTAHAYDAAWMLFYGAAWASVQGEVDSGPDIARGLRHLSSGDAFQVVPSSWSGIQAAFSNNDDADIRGASGELDFDPETEEPSAPIEIWTLTSDGQGGFTITPVTVES